MSLHRLSLPTSPHLISINLSIHAVINGLISSIRIKKLFFTVGEVASEHLFLWNVLWFKTLQWVKYHFATGWPALTQPWILDDIEGVAQSTEVHCALNFDAPINLVFMTRCDHHLILTTYWFKFRSSVLSKAGLAGRARFHCFRHDGLYGARDYIWGERESRGRKKP